MFCVYCGTKLPDEARFCFMCGRKSNPPTMQKISLPPTAEASTKKDSASKFKRPPQPAPARNPDTPEFAVEDGPIEDAHDASATANESGPDETSAEDQSSEQAHGISESADENDHDEIEEAQGSNSAELDTPNSSSNETTVIPLATSSSKTTVIPLAAPSDKTTILPGFGAEKAALEQEKSDEIAALAALYPDANPAQFCDPTPFEAKSPDITELIALHPLMAPSQPLRNRSITPKAKKKKSAGSKRALLYRLSLQSSQCLQRPPHSACHSTFYPTSPLICGYQSRQ